MRTSQRDIPNDLRGYVPDGLLIRGVYFPETHGWTAIAIDFDIAGAGESSEEAIHDLTAGVLEYLRLCRADGVDFDHALRPADDEVREMFEQALRAELERFTPGGRKPEREAPQFFKTPVAVC